MIFDQDSEGCTERLSRSFSFSWSRDGHKLVSASTDNMVSQWDVLTGDCDQRFRFPSPILKVQYHPRDQ